MTLWGVRAGKHGQNEACLDRNVIAIGWDDLGDISSLSSRDQLDRLIAETYPDQKHTTTRIWTGEVWAFRERITEADLVALPLKSQSAVAFGEVTGPYRYDGSAPTEAQHQRPVTWRRTDVSRTEIDQDILFSLGSTLTVFQVQRENAEQRVRALLAGHASTWKQPSSVGETPISEAGLLDIEQNARDQITNFIGRRFKGHDLPTLVAGILNSQGYKVVVSPPGADGGIDIVAGRGPMGFDPPRLCVQVKSTEAPVDVGVLRELRGVMRDFGAEQGLIVSWGGFRSSVLREARRQFFEIRLWDAGDVVSALQHNYTQLSADLQAEIPLKRVWVMVPDEQ